MLSNYREEVNRAKQNLVHTVRYNKETVGMNLQEKAYWSHFLSGDPLVGDYIRSQIRQNPQLRREILNQPVCIKCEGFTFFHNGGAQCPTCGTWTPEGKTHSVKKHLKEGYYR